MITCAARSAVVAGFQTTVLPTIAGATARLPPIDVKLKGLIASTNPSSGRWSIRFHVPADDTGCVSWSCSPKCTFQRQKSISSQAASISACCTLLLCPRIVAALSRSRKGPLRRSAARRNTAALLSQDAVDQSWWAFSAASTASRTSSVVAVSVSTMPRVWRCGALTTRCSPWPSTGRPPMWSGTLCGALACMSSWRRGGGRAPVIPVRTAELARCVVAENSSRRLWRSECVE